VTVTTLVECLDLPAVLSRARSRRDTETDTVQFAQAALAAAKREGLQLAVRARGIRAKCARRVNEGAAGSGA
jgi:adenylate cyclase